MTMMRDRNFAAELTALDVKINTFLPPRYQHCYATVPPTSMGSAGVRYGRDGKVVWDEIWTSFCDLAMAGGPPHRGKLLEPVSGEEVEADPARYADVVAELGRAIGLTTRLPVVEGYAPGWVGARCESPEEAAWLQVAITAENVSARRRQTVLQLPAGPAFRVEKEIKNVVVALAKSYHYWEGHLTADQQHLAGDNLAEPATPAEAAADPSAYEAAVAEAVEGLREAGLPVARRQYAGWVGIETPSEEDAVWLLRAVLVERMLVRREDAALYLPVGATPSEAHAARLAWTFNRAWELRQASSPRRWRGR